MIDHRPRVHLRPVAGWTNDPIGPVHWAGRTHLFHQVNPDGGYWDRPHWGHVSSDDLVRWRRHPLALSPDPDPDAADADGCFSGCVVVDGDEAVLVYTGVNGPAGPGQTQASCLARSREPELERWTKDPANPVTVVPRGHDLTGFRDPFVWREDGRWWQLVGTGSAERGGAAWLFSSDDLTTWSDEGPALDAATLVTRDGLQTWTGSMWECPALVRTPQGDALILSVHDGVTTHHPIAVLGTFTGGRFVGRRIQRLDLGPDVYAPCLYTAPDGRLIIWGWSWEATTAARQRTQGWAGMLTLPRELTVDADRVAVRPIEEFTGLRGDELSVERLATPGGWLTGAELARAGNVVDLEVALGPAAEVVSLRLCRAPDLQEYTTLEVDRHRGELWLDRAASSLDPDAGVGRVGGAIHPSPGRELRLRIVIDRSIVEVFVDDRISLTARIYPTRADSTGIEVVGSPTAVADVELQAWNLDSIWSAS